MALEEEEVAMEGITPMLFRWPLPEEEEPLPVQAIPLLRRQDGILMAFPSTAITDAMADAWSEPNHPGEEALVGARMRCFVPVFTGIGEPERSVEVLVLDLASPPGDTMFEPYKEELADFPFAIRFLEEGNVDTMNMDNLMAQVREWLSPELGDRMAFYSAQEEEEIPGEAFSPPMRRKSALRPGRPSHPGGTSISGPGMPVAPQHKAATPKKPTVASLAAKVDQIMDVLPTLTAQLQAMADQQERLGPVSPSRTSPKANQPYTQPAPRASMPLSSQLVKQQTSPTALASLLGPPPRTRFSPEEPPSAQIRQMAEDEPVEMDADPQNQPADHYLAALLAQSRALNTLVSHLQG